VPFGTVPAEYFAIVRCMMRFCATHDEALSFAVASDGKMA
jgi:hypothetical protein